MERLADLPGKIQEALGGFYFVGDEDLVEIIGNGLTKLMYKLRVKRRSSTSRWRTRTTRR